MIDIKENFLTKNRCYIQNKKMNNIEGIVVHSVGCPQPKKEVFLKTWNTPNVSVCVHAILDDKGIVQTLPWDVRCWGCGSGPKGSFNSSHIQFEICEPSNVKYKGGSLVNYNSEINKDFFEACYKNAVSLCVYLCKKFNLSPSSIVCHSEAHTLGYGSNHSDVMHWFPKHNKNMDIFREDVRKGLNNEDITEQVIKEYKQGDKVKLENDNKTYTIENIEDNKVKLSLTVDKKDIKEIIKEYAVKVIDDSLNYREGPGVEYKINGTIRDRGTYHIVEEVNGWGKLKSGAGWIKLSYTQKIN